MATILVVEDEIAIAEMLGALFEDEGYEVRTAANGRQALAALTAKAADLVLTDTMMPLMSGPELVAAMAAQPELAAIAVVAMSAMPEWEVRPAYVRCEAFIHKPFRLHEVAATIAAVLG